MMIQNKKDAVQDILDNIDLYQDDSGLDTVKMETFYSDGVMINRNPYPEAAKKDLADFKPSDADDPQYKPTQSGVYGAIELIQNYADGELDGYGDIDFSDPCDLANKIDFIRGSYVFEQILIDAGVDEYDDCTQENIEKVQAACERALKA